MRFLSWWTISSLLTLLASFMLVAGSRGSIRSDQTLTAVGALVVALLVIPYVSGMMTVYRREYPWILLGTLLVFGGMGAVAAFAL